MTLLTGLCISSLCITTICNLRYSRFGFERGSLALIASVPGHCLLVTIKGANTGKS